MLTRLSKTEVLSTSPRGSLKAAAPGVQSLMSCPLIAVVVDGTWRQAKRMHRDLEALPHVKLSPCSLSEFHWRRQSQEGRISTVEAAALLLEEFGDASEGIPLLLRHALGVLNRALE